MTDNEQINLRSTAKVARKHISGLIISNFFGYIIWSVIYAVIIYFGANYIIENYDYSSAAIRFGGVILYLLVLGLTFLLRIRAIYSGFKGAALDAAEEVISGSSHKGAKVGAKGFKILRWFIG